jgi:hypothetical protein
MTTPKGQARLSIEAVMQKGTRENPLSFAQIAARSGVEAVLARVHIATILKSGAAYDLNDGARGKGLYAWGDAPKPTNEPRSYARPLPYTGEKAAPIHDGAMRAYEIPSLGDSERKRPFIMGAKPEHRA